ncbi:PTS system mannose/fructose/sorbose family transporter subunit IID [Enterococcus faecium]|uniref:PTS system mannose/fructose/sorbose family transporter subunit IID n=1 Tax=Enterococcus faecium TaxID=1352 RepID=UPI004044D148
MNFSIQPKYDKIIQKKDLQRLFWFSVPYETAWNFERMSNVGFCFGLLPILKKLYPKKEDLSDAMKRHLEVYNMTPYISTLPLSIAAAMEEANVMDEEFDTSSISAVKLAMMGPLSGIGDAFFWGTLRIVATAVGTSLALKGSILGPILFFLVFNVPHFAIRYALTFVGYGLGSNVISKLRASGILDKIMQYASIMGMIVVGAMTMDMTKVNFISKIGFGEDAPTLQSLVDGVAPGLSVLLIFYILYRMLKKKMNPLLIMLVILVASLVLAYFKILGA